MKNADESRNSHRYTAGWSSWQLVGLITQRSEVRVLPPLLKRLMSIHQSLFCLCRAERHIIMITRQYTCAKRLVNSSVNPPPRSNPASKKFLTEHVIFTERFKELRGGFQGVRLGVHVEITANLTAHSLPVDFGTADSHNVRRIPPVYR